MQSLKLSGTAEECKVLCRRNSYNIAECLLCWGLFWIALFQADYLFFGGLLVFLGGAPSVSS